MEATFIKLDDDGDGEDEIKGFVENLVGAEFDVRGITYNGYSGSPVLAEGDFVEVHFDPASCSTPPNIAFKGHFEKQFPDHPPVSFFQWMVLALPLHPAMSKPSPASVTSLSGPLL